jgi:hypothetical protein
MRRSSEGMLAAVGNEHFHDAEFCELKNGSNYLLPAPLFTVLHFFIVSHDTSCNLQRLQTLQLAQGSRRKALPLAAAPRTGTQHTPPADQICRAAFAHVFKATCARRRMSA